MVMGLRQMAVPAGGVIAAGLLPMLAHLGGLRLAFGVPAAARARQRPRRSPPSSGPGQRDRVPGARGWVLPAGLPRLLLVGGLYVSALGGVLAFTAARGRGRGPQHHRGRASSSRCSTSAPASPASSGAASPTASAARAACAPLVDVGLRRHRRGARLPAAGARRRRSSPRPRALALAFGVLGFNGIVYLIAGELGGPQRRRRRGRPGVDGRVQGRLARRPARTACWRSRPATTTMYLVVAGCMLAGAAVARGLAAPVRAAHAVAA